MGEKDLGSDGILIYTKENRRIKKMDAFNKGFQEERFVTKKSARMKGLK